jgi:hypothetical protein
LVNRATQRRKLRHILAISILNCLEEAFKQDFIVTGAFKPDTGVGTMSAVSNVGGAVSTTSAVIIDLAHERMKRATLAASAIITLGQLNGSQQFASQATHPATPFLFWTGASGTRYVHTVHNLFECPPVAAANYILVKRHSDGNRTVISIGRAAHEAGTLNLAEIRLRSAQLGANEVHVHLLAGSASQSQDIEADLRRSLAVA